MDMTEKTIKIPKGVRYLGEVLDSLPKDSLFNKGITGCGGTHIALTNNAHYIIAVPFVSLVQNKVKGYGGSVVGVHGGTDAREVKEYLRDTGIPVKKLIATYDSLPRAIELVRESGMEIGDFHLLVDEYHILFEHYSFRKQAVRAVLDNYRSFKEYCFMTATPLDEDSTIQELEGLQKVRCHWEGEGLVEVVTIRCRNGVLQSTIGLVNRFLEGEIEGNAYIFVNDVSFIRSVVKHCGLTGENTRAVWSKSSIQTIKGIRNGEASDPPKKINFFTSTCFEGCDIFDKEGRTYVICDGNREHTLLNISTSIRQIAGRVRDSRYVNTIEHLCTSNNRYDRYLSLEDFEDSTRELEKVSREFVNTFNQSSDRVRKILAKGMGKELYVSLSDGGAQYDDNMRKQDLHKFKVRNMYRSGYSLSMGYHDAGVHNTDYRQDTSWTTLANLDDTGDTYKETVQILEGLMEKESTAMIHRLANGESTDSLPESYNLRTVKLIVFKKYPWMEDALRYIGMSGIRDMGYRPSNIKRALKQYIPQDKMKAVRERLEKDKRTSIGTVLTAGEAKEVVRDIYRELGIGRSPKGSDLQDFLKVRKTTSRKKGSTPVTCYVVEGKK